MKNTNKYILRHRDQAFTLIELLVVVTIIATLCAFAIPVFTSVIAKSREAKVEKVLAEERAENQHEEIRGAAPVIDSLRIELGLASSDHRRGLEVYTRFELRAKGTITIKKRHGSTEPVRMSLPFPNGTKEAWNVRLLVHGTGGEASEPADVVYDQSGIHWQSTMEGPVTADFAWEVAGNELLELPLPDAYRLGEVDITLYLEGVPAHSIPDFALQPTAGTTEEVHWAFENLVSRRPIIVDLPGAQSPVNRLLEMCRFMAVSLFVFGAGFWYLAEQDRPGQLDSFRLGHFSRLALTFLLFFVVFAVIVYQGDLGLLSAMVVSAIVSLPLLVLHVSRIVGTRFACTRILPLAVLSLGIVIVGIYGVGMRPYFFLACLVIVTAYLTITYQPKRLGDSVANPVPA